MFGCGLVYKVLIPAGAGIFLWKFQPLNSIKYTRNRKIIMFLGSKVWQMHRTDNLATICELIV
jgi:hypothetical protein